MTGSRSNFVQSTAFLPLPQLILIPVGLVSILSYFIERHEVAIGRQEQHPSRDPEERNTAPQPGWRRRRTVVAGLATTIIVLIIVGASLFVQFRREEGLTRELRGLEPYPGVIVMETTFERAWLLSNRTTVRSEYSTTAGYMAISEYYEMLLQKQGWNSLPVEAHLREMRFCKGPYQVRLEYPEQKLDVGYRYAVEIRVDGCS